MKIIEIVTPIENFSAVESIITQHDSEILWVNVDEDKKKKRVRTLVSDDQRQSVLDALQGLFRGDDHSKILVMAVEASLPRKEPTSKIKDSSDKSSTTREELYNEIEKNTRLDSTYLLLVFLSTVVVSIGLLENNVAAVIGAMVIAPLLGPNIALALGAALGDMPLMWKAFKTMVTGIGFDCFSIGFWCSGSNFFNNGTFQRAGRGDGSGCLIASYCYSWNNARCGTYSACNWCGHIACGKYCLRESGGKDGVSIKRD